MLIPERMKKVTVIGPKTVMEKTVLELHNLKAVHITDHKKQNKEELDIGTPFAKAEKLSELLVSVRAISAALGITNKTELSNGFRAIGVKNFSGLEKEVNRLNTEVEKIIISAKETESEIKKLDVESLQIESVQKLGVNLESFSDYKSLAFFIGTVKDVKKLRESILIVTDKFELFSAQEKPGFSVAIFIDKASSEKISEVLSDSGFIETPINEIKGKKGSASDALNSIKKKTEQLQKRNVANAKSIGKLGVKWNDFLVLSEDLISKELEKAEAPLRFGVSKSAFVIEGWVPSETINALEEKLSKATQEKIYVKTEKPIHDDKVPVKMKNTKFAKPFEFFMGLYSLPKYNEIDPTLFMFFTFPLFFGLILGDVGYGLVVFFLLLWLKDKIPASASLVNVIIPASIASIIFGFLFGEVFGFEHAFGFDFPRILSRTHEINAMLMVSGVVGLLHINFGLLLGFINELHHGLLKAFSAKISWMLLQVGVALIALSAMGMVNLPIYAGIVLAIGSIILIYLGEGPKGIVELPGLLSNLLSYTRLAAVGLASVSLAVVVNEMAVEISHSGTIGMIISVIILLVGHTINIALGMLGGFLHSLRLHYVEFFTKFFEGGAIPFKPFGLKSQ
jgi:V/A-type H+/Na+-transporting ATPase subunit I